MKANIIVMACLCLICGIAAASAFWTMPARVATSMPTFMVGVGSVDVNDYPTNCERLRRCCMLVGEQLRVEAFLRATPFSKPLDMDDPNSVVSTALTAGQIQAIKDYVIACRSDISALQTALSMAEY